MIRFPFAVLLAAVFLLAGFQSTDRTLPDSSSHYSSADTLYFGGAVGDLVIVQLPDEISSGSVSEWSLTRGPALSWLYGSSFFWRTLPDEYGVHRIDVQARTAGDMESVVVLISLD